MIEVGYRMGRDEKWVELWLAVRGCYVDKGLEIGINPVFTSGPLVSSLYDPGSVNDPGSLPHLYSCLPIICTAN